MRTLQEQLHSSRATPTQAGGIRSVTSTDDYCPDHDGGKFTPILATVATWRAPAFLENLAIDPEGAVFVSVYSHHRVDRYDPATGATTTLAEVPAPPMGLAFDASDALWVTAGTLREGPGYIYRVGRDGAVRQWCELPDALFINGCTMHPNGGTLLVCESASGRILAIDLEKPGRWRVWLQGDRLKPIVPGYPGSNGIKIRDGWAWISVSGRSLMVRVPIQSDGSAGRVEIAATRLSADDFAFGASGSVYIATHPEHTLVRLEPSGVRSTLAGPDQGMVGSTACAFGRAPGDENAIYVTTDGGFLIPHESGIQDAKLVRMEVGESGWPLLQGA
jgi:sugar lactone lactonase YvrE